MLDFCSRAPAIEAEVASLSIASVRFDYPFERKDAPKIAGQRSCPTTQRILTRLSGIAIFWCCMVASVSVHPAFAELANEPTVPVLVYHQISTPEHPLALKDDVIELARFSEQMEYLHTSGYHTISTSQLIDFMLHV